MFEKVKKPSKKSEANVSSLFLVMMVAVSFLMAMVLGGPSFAAEETGGAGIETVTTIGDKLDLPDVGGGGTQRSLDEYVDQANKYFDEVMDQANKDYVATTGKWIDKALDIYFIISVTIIVAIAIIIGIILVAVITNKRKNKRTVEEMLSRLRHIDDEIINRSKH